MAITYTWQFPQFEVAPSLDGESDVVFTVHWRCNGVDASQAG